MAQTGLPIILSTGMCTLDEVGEALAVLASGYLGRTPASRADFRRIFNSAPAKELVRSKVTILHCTTDYPTALEDVNLLALDALRDSFALPVGYSDHTEGITVPIAAAAR